MINEALLAVEGLKKYFPARSDWFAQLFDRRVIKAVDCIHFKISHGKTLGLVGESGSGKSTTGYCCVGLAPPTEGSITYHGRDVTILSEKELRKRGRYIQMIFQDPSSSLNPRKTARQIVSEPLRIHQLAVRSSMRKRVVEILEAAGLSERFLSRYPHEMSGGQRQRVGIARALAVEPELIICDEPVTALDVSIQAQIINLLMDLQDDLGLTYLFIAHDLSVIKHVSDDIAVMYLGKIFEKATKTTLFDEPKHPYTRALLAAIPTPHPKSRNRCILEGEIPSAIDLPSGCRFHPRCPERIGGICRDTEPEPRELPNGTRVLCHKYKYGS